MKLFVKRIAKFQHEAKSYTRRFDIAGLRIVAGLYVTQGEDNGVSARIAFWRGERGAMLGFSVGIPVLLRPSLFVFRGACARGFAVDWLCFGPHAFFGRHDQLDASEAAWDEYLKRNW